ncbi:DUF1361 domain-containing protein [Agromyces sp. M3QZ16-3]|uniref:DUF1361 domain-containing protein n=1 Tax=Agromyces sp. M3QZ16-3 TaxID=3447585 RepID=UPI003F68D969
MNAAVAGTIALVALNAYAVVLIVLRARVYGVALYRPMIVNVGLSFLPVVGAVFAFAVLIALVPALVALPSWGIAAAPFLEWAYLLVATGLWVLFFPNSIYLITELNFSHRGPDDPVPLWYDIVQTLTLTLSGIANAVFSLGVVQTAFVLIVLDPAEVSAGPPAASWWFAGAVIVLGALGVYLGRYLRFNSWDVRHPGSMLRKTREYFAPGGRVADMLGFVASHAVLVGLVYVPVYLATFVAAVTGARAS